MKKIVILKKPFMNFIDSHLLEGKLRMLRTLFPECEIEIREKPPVHDPDEEIYTKAFKQ